MHSSNKQEKRLVIVCFIVAFIMIVSFISKLFH